QCRHSSLIFYRAVRDRRPPWALEELRTMGVFHWERGPHASRTAYTPSEALLYAIVHDHRAYARHLLKLGPPSALAPPGPAFGASHLATAVRYDRVELLLLLLRVARHCCDSFRLSDYVNAAEVTPTWGPGAGRTPLHLACQLAKPECTRILLAHGARADVADMQGEFPLDALLEPLEGPLGSSKREGNGGPVPPGCRACQRARCLELLLLFSPPGGRGPPSSGSARALLERAPERWCALLGTETWMRALGRSPPSLRACALRELLRGGERARGAMLDSLPI
uniref:Zgc:112001 n=1 Tax=Petromyzon marinus TaxID=7757 RepID=S4RWB1_PETMA